MGGYQDSEILKTEIRTMTRKYFENKEKLSSYEKELNTYKRDILRKVSEYESIYGQTDYFNKIKFDRNLGTPAPTPQYAPGYRPNYPRTYGQEYQTNSQHFTPLVAFLTVIIIGLVFILAITFLMIAQYA